MIEILENIFGSSISVELILISIAFVVIFTAIISFISKLLKQELILAYVISGIIIGPLILGLIKNTIIIKSFAEIGITFLLFAAGLEMSFRKLKDNFRTTMLVGIIQVIIVAIVGFFILIAFKFSKIEALWLGIAIAFSSTVVITKILSDRNELNTLHARFIIGIMLAQDIIAIATLAILTKNFSFNFIFLTLAKLIFIGVIAVILNILSKKILKKSASSPELLFIISLSFLFLLVLVSYFLKLPVAIGAFLAGIVLSNTIYKLEIESRTKALRDFFAVMFFVSIGMLLTSISVSILLPLVCMLFVLIIIEPLVTAFIIKLRGYKTKTSLQIGFAFGQLSEFTLILILSALSLGIISQRAFDLIILAAVISIAITPYTMKLDGFFYRIIGNLLDKIKTTKEEEKIIRGKKTIFIFGCHRMGSIYLKNLQEYKNKILVIDFDPEIIDALSKQGISCIYGDASNKEFIENLNLKDAKIVISTIPRMKENELLIKCVKEKNKNVFIAVTAEKIHDALEFYELGADYVILPLIVGAEHAISQIIELRKKDFKNLKKEHIKHLNELHKLLY